jgi:hypothetical protein
MGHPFRPLGFGTITIRSGVTGITELAAKSTVSKSETQALLNYRFRVRACRCTRRSMLPATASLPVSANREVFLIFHGESLLRVNQISIPAEWRYPS